MKLSNYINNAKIPSIFVIGIFLSLVLPVIIKFFAKLLVSNCLVHFSSIQWTFSDYLAAVSTISASCIFAFALLLFENSFNKENELLSSQVKEISLKLKQLSDHIDEIDPGVLSMNNHTKAIRFRYYYNSLDIELKYLSQIGKISGKTSLINKENALRKLLIKINQSSDYDGIIYYSADEVNANISKIRLQEAIFNFKAALLELS